MCQGCDTQGAGLYGTSRAQGPTDDHMLAYQVRLAMLTLANATDEARKAGLQVDFTARFAGYASAPVAVVPGSIHLAEISRTTTRKVVL